MRRSFPAIAILASLLGCQLAAQDFRVRPATEVSMAIQPDSNSPAFWRDGRLFWYGSHGSPWLNQGPDQFGPWETRYATVPSPDNAPKWMEAVWPENDGVLWGWYHAEPVNLIPDSTLTAPKIGAALSLDGGYTMNDLGFILASGEPINPAAQNGYFAGGHGDPSVILDRQHKYFYFFFGHYGGPAESQGVCVARMAFADRSNPSGAVWKYHDGQWQEPGLGGRVTPIFAVRKPWGARDPDAFWGPAVHWNTHLNCYVMLLNHAAGAGWSQEGVYISFSPDLSRPELWTPPRKVIDKSELGDPGAYYPQVMGFGPGDTDRRAGQIARLYVHGTSKWELEFIAPATAPAAVTVSASPPPAIVTAGGPASMSVAAMGQPSFTYQWLKDGEPIPGATSPIYDIPGATAADAGVYSAVVTNALGTAVSDSVTLLVTARPPPPATSFLSNLSVRSWLPAGDATLTLGFALQGAEPKPVVLRAIGPTLGLFGIADAAIDPHIAVFDASATGIAENDNWNSTDGSAFAATGAFPLPEGSADAALVVTALPGTTTAHVTSTGGGVLLAEIYDAAAAPNSKFVNASARAVVGPDSHALIGGFTVSGSGSKRLLIRALGPQLAAFGVENPMANPLLEVFDAAGNQLALNDDWDPALEPTFTSAGAMSLPLESRDAAVVVTLPAGNAYTVVVRTTDGSTGEALLEIYELP